MSESMLCPNPDCRKPLVLSQGDPNNTVTCPYCGTLSGSGKSSGGMKAVAATTTKAIGRFEILKKLGAGAFGTVYQAKDAQLDRSVALKVPNAGVLTTPQRVERFLREAKAAAGLRHPHIVPVFDAGKSGDRYYIASAYIAGKKLSDTIPETGDDFQRCARIVRQLAEALAYAHREGVVHRDVKPDNIIVDTQDQMHLADFGLASRQDEESRLTNEGAILGTPSYMAPEIAAGQKGEANPSVDQYAAGVVLYEMLCGQVPFEGPPAIILHNVIHTPPAIPSKQRPGIPRDLETICLKAMAKRPEDRYPTCQELADDLRRYLDGEPISARRLSPLEQLVRWTKRNRVVASLSLAVAVALIAGTIVSYSFAVAANSAATVAQANEQKAKEQETKANEAVGRLTSEQEKTLAALKIADEERKKADMERGIAQKERDTAKQAQAETEEERKKVVLEVERTKQALAAVEAAQAKERLASYGSKIALARLQLENKQPAQAIRTLNDCLEEQRSFEWYWLNEWAEKGAPSIKSMDVQTSKKLIDTAAISPDGNWVAFKFFGDPFRFEVVVISTNNPTQRKVFTVKLGQRKPGDPLPETICSMGFSPDGKLLGALSHQQAWVWSMETMKEISHIQHEPFGYNFSNSKLCFDSKGEKIAVVAGDSINTGCGGIWDVATAKKLVDLEYTRSAVSYTLSFLSNDTIVSNGIVSWDATTGKVRADGVIFSGNASSLLESPDRRYLAVTTHFLNKDISLYDRQTKKMSKLTGHVEDVKVFGFSHDSKRLFSASKDGVLKIWDLVTQREIIDLPNSEPIVALQQETKTNSLLTLSNQGKVSRISIGSVKKATESVIETGRGEVIQISHLPTENQSLILSSYGCRIIDWTDKSIVASWAVKDRFDFGFVSPDGKLLCTIRNDFDNTNRNYHSTIRLYEPKSGRMIIEKKLEDGSFKKAIWSTDSKTIYLDRVYAKNVDDVLSIWQIDPMTEFEHVKVVRNFHIIGRHSTKQDQLIAVMPDKKNIIDSNLVSFDVKTKKVTEIYPTKQLHFSTLSFDKSLPIQNVLFIPYFKEILSLNVATKKLGSIPCEQPLNLRGAFYVEPKSKWFAIGTATEAVEIRSIPSGKVLTTLAGAGKDVTTLNSTPDGQMLIAGSANRLKLWPIQASWSE